MNDSPLTPRDRRIRRAGSSLSDSPSLPLLFAALVAGLSVNVGGDYMSLAAAALAVLWALHRPMSMRIDAIVTLSILIIIWSAVSLLWSESEKASWALLTQLVIITVFLIMRDLIRSMRDLHIVANGLLLGVAVSVARLVLVGSPSAQYGDLSRVTLDAFNANYLGYSFVGAVGVNIALYQSTARHTRWVRWLSISISIVGTILTDTRGAQIAVLLLLAWLVLCRIFSPPIRTLVVSVILATFLMSLGIVDRFLERLDFGDRSTGDLSGRFELWHAAREIWYENFFTGSGLLGTVTSESLGVDAHSVVLETGANAGLIGLILLITHFIVTLSPLPGYKLTEQGKLILGSFLVVSTPIYLSGAWGWALTAWVVLAIFSRAIQLNTRSSTQENSHIGT